MFLGSEGWVKKPDYLLEENAGEHKHHHFFHRHGGKGGRKRKLKGEILGISSREHCSPSPPPSLIRPCYGSYILTSFILVRSYKL